MEEEKNKNNEKIYASNDEEFYSNIDKLKDFYNKKPAKTLRQLRYCIDKLSYSKKNKFIKNEDKPIFYQVLIIIIIALIGLFASLPNIEECGIYLFGLVFFASGIFIGLYVNIFGIIFLFSHGMTGYIIMMVTILGKLFNSPIMSDSPIGIYIGIGIIVLLSVIAVLLTIINNLSTDIENKKRFAVIPLILFAVALLIATIIPMVVEHKYGIRLSSEMFFE